MLFTYSFLGLIPYPSLLILLFHYTTSFLGLAYYFFLGLGLILILILGIWAYLYLGHVLLDALAWPASKALYRTGSSHLGGGRRTIILWLWGVYCTTLFIGLALADYWLSSVSSVVSGAFLLIL